MVAVVSGERTEEGEPRGGGYASVSRSCSVKEVSEGVPS